MRKRGEALTGVECDLAVLLDVGRRAPGEAPATAALLIPSTWLGDRKTVNAHSNEIKAGP